MIIALFLLRVLSFFPTDWVQTFSNELFPLRRTPKIIIFIETTAHPPLPASLLTITTVSVCSCLLSFSKYLCNDIKSEIFAFHGGVTVDRGRLGLLTRGWGTLCTLTDVPGGRVLCAPGMRLMRFRLRRKWVSEFILLGMHFHSLPGLPVS